MRKQSNLGTVRFFSNVIALSVLFSALACPPARAAPALEFSATDVTGSFSDPNHRVVGWVFTVNSPIVVDQLGFLDMPNAGSTAFGDGLVQAHEVGIFNTQTSQLVVSATVPALSAGTLNGVYRYVSIPQTALDAGNEYVVAAQITGSGDQWVWTGNSSTGNISGVSVANVQVNPDITLLPVDTVSTSRFNCCALTPLTFPATEDGPARGAFVAANFSISSPVPEPEQVVMMSAGLSLLIAANARRRISHRNRPRTC